MTTPDPRRCIAVATATPTEVDRGEPDRIAYDPTAWLETPEALYGFHPVTPRFTPAWRIES